MAVAGGEAGDDDGGSRMFQKSSEGRRSSERGGEATAVGAEESAVASPDSHSHWNIERGKQITSAIAIPANVVVNWRLSHLPAE